MTDPSPLQHIVGDPREQTPHTDQLLDRFLDTMAARDEADRGDAFIRFLLCLLYVVAGCAAGYILHLTWLEFTSGSTEYTVTITSADGLEQRSDRAAALSPVFGVAVRINNTLYKAGERCVGVRSSMVVSYGDAVLGKGAVPEFCARALGVGEAAATACGVDVQMSRFLRNRLAGELERGEAVLDVAVRATGGCMNDVAVRASGGGTSYIRQRCMDKLLLCKAKIGGGPSPPCLVTQVDPRSMNCNG